MQHMMLALHRVLYAAVLSSLLFFSADLENEAAAGPIVQGGASDAVGSTLGFEATSFLNGAGFAGILDALFFPELFLATPAVGQQGLQDTSHFIWGRQNDLALVFDPRTNSISVSITNRQTGATSMVSLQNLDTVLDVNGTPIEISELNVLDISFELENPASTISLLDIMINGAPPGGGNDLISMGALTEFHIGEIDLTQVFTLEATIELNGEFDLIFADALGFAFGFEIPVVVNGPAVWPIFSSASLYLFICQRRRRSLRRKYEDKGLVHKNDHAIPA